jgi:hypothetical protein
MTKGCLVQEYRGMRIEYRPHRENREDGKVEAIWMIEAYRGNELKGGCEFVTMRTGSFKPGEEFYVATINDIGQSGINLVNKLIRERR